MDAKETKINRRGRRERRENAENNRFGLMTDFARKSTILRHWQYAEDQKLQK
jgi:hypothetical protein